MRGATKQIFEEMYLCYISIHAPHEGCDAITMAMANITINFNPRTP